MLTTATAESGKAGRSLNSIPTRVEKTLSNLYMYKIDAEVSKGDAPGGFPERDTVKQQPHSSVHSFDKHVLALVALADPWGGPGGVGALLTPAGRGVRGDE